MTFLRVMVVFCVLSVSICPWAFAQEVDAQAKECMALNLYWEARSEGVEGMTAVGWVVLNRMKDSRYPESVCGVINPCTGTARGRVGGFDSRPKTPLKVSARSTSS